MNTNQKIKMLLLISLLINTGCMNDKNLGYGHFKNDVKNNQIQLVVKWIKLLFQKLNMNF